MDYRNYYNLEEYLFREVGPKFRKEGVLSTADFFCVVIWKANRSKTKIKKKLSKDKSLAVSVKEISTAIANAKTKEEKLDVLRKEWKFGLPMATAILSVLYPEEFTVYDYRVRKQLQLRDIYSSKKYFTEFLPQVITYKNSKGISLREADKELWGKSAYDDLMKLIGT